MHTTVLAIDSNRATIAAGPTHAAARDAARAIDALSAHEADYIPETFSTVRLTGPADVLAAFIGQIGLEAAAPRRIGNIEAIRRGDQSGMGQGYALHLAMYRGSILGVAADPAATLTDEQPDGFIQVQGFRTDVRGWLRALPLYAGDQHNTELPDDDDWTRLTSDAGIAAAAA